ncbi:MAG: MBL fold metallo-hydrolase [Chryseolinea sp.]
MKYIITLILAVCGHTLFAQENFDSVKVTAQKLSDHVYMLKGAGGNIGILVGNDGTLMVDDQFAPLTNKINGVIKSIDPGEIRFLINTHIHGDHSGSNENFKRMGATVVAQDNVFKRMSSESVNSRTKEVTPPRDKDAWPVVTFPNSMTLHLNDETIELVYFGPAHTDGDLAVWFKGANIFHMGDMFVTYGYPYIDYGSGGSVNGFIANLDKVIGLMNDQTKIIPGHGDICTINDVKTLRNKIADIRDQVAAALKKGKKPEEITGMGITDKYEAELGKGFIKGKDFVLLAAENLKLNMPVGKK